MKISSLSKAALAGMLIAGSLASAPLVANADSSSDPVTVTTEQGDNKKVSVTVKTNDDGSKTVSVTMPKDQVIGDADSKGNTFTAKTDPSEDSQTNVDKGKVTVKGNNAEFKIELDSSAVDNDDLMNTPLQIDISDMQGKHIGKITNVTLNQLLKQAQNQKAESNSSSSKLESSLASSASSSSKTNSSSQASSNSNSGDWWLKNNGNSSEQKNATQPSNTNSQSSDNQSSGTSSSSNSAANDNSQNRQVQTYNSVADLVAAMKKNGVGSVKGSSVIVTPSNVQIDDDGTMFDGGNSTLFTSSDKYDQNLVKTGQPVEVTVETVDDSSQWVGNQGNDKNNGDYNYYIHFSNARTPDNANGRGANGQGANGQNGSANGSQNANGANSQNGSIPQTGDSHSVWTVIAGAFSTGLGVLGEVFTKKLF